MIDSSAFSPTSNAANRLKDDLCRYDLQRWQTAVQTDGTSVRSQADCRDLRGVLDTALDQAGVHWIWHRLRPLSGR
jgi:hypothetical protein